MVPRYLAALTLILMVGMVVTRVLLMRRKGIKAMKFGAIDRKDFLIPPFALVYFYIVFAAAFGLPNISSNVMLNWKVAPWVGAAFCLAGLAFLVWSFASFGKSFRVGIDNNCPDRLITTGAFAYSRNPVYVAFAFILIGEFLIFPNWILLLYLGAGTWLFHRQVKREEEFLGKQYGQEYRDYCRSVRRYL